MQVFSKRLYGKPAERLILLALAKKQDCECQYNEDTGVMIVRGPNAFKVDEDYRAVISVAYKRLAFLQADHRFDSVPIKTLTSEFMEAYSAIACSLISGNAFSFVADTETKRAGIKAASQMEEVK